MGAADASAESTIRPTYSRPAWRPSRSCTSPAAAPPPGRATRGLCSPAYAPSRTMVTAFLSPRIIHGERTSSSYGWPSPSQEGLPGVNISHAGASPVTG